MKSLPKIILVGTLATAVLKIGAVAVALVIVLALPYIAANRLNEF